MSEDQVSGLSAEKTTGRESGLPIVTIEYDIKTVTVLSRLNKRLYLILTGLIFAIYGICGLIFLALEIESDILSATLVQYIYALLFGLCCLLVNPVMYALSPILAKKKAKKLQRTDKLVFGEKIICTTRSLHLVEEKLHDWSVFTKAAETKKYFFLFIAYGVEKIGAFAVRKTDLKNCTTDEFRNLLKAKLGERCKIK